MRTTFSSLSYMLISLRHWTFLVYTTALLYTILNASINDVLNPHVSATIAHVTPKAVCVTMARVPHHLRHAYPTCRITISVDVLSTHPVHHLWRL